MRQEIDIPEHVHRIDPDDRICFVNDAWWSFAAENDWPASPADVLGSPLMSHISDPETRHIYRLLIDRARDTGRSALFHYRCDSPELRRFMEMRITSGDRGEVEFRSRLLRLERREPMPVLDVQRRQRMTDTWQICSWCKSVCAASAWLQLEEAVQRLGVFVESVLPQLSHGICPTCRDRMLYAGGVQ